MSPLSILKIAFCIIFFFGIIGGILSTSGWPWLIATVSFLYLCYMFFFDWDDHGNSYFNRGTK